LSTESRDAPPPVSADSPPKDWEPKDWEPKDTADAAELRRRSMLLGARESSSPSSPREKFGFGGLPPACDGLRDGGLLDGLSAGEEDVRFAGGPFVFFLLLPVAAEGAARRFSF
jgi:hypothetical protein